MVTPRVLCLSGIGFSFVREEKRTLSVLLLLGIVVGFDGAIDVIEEEEEILKFTNLFSFFFQNFFSKKMSS